MMRHLRWDRALAAVLAVLFVAGAVIGVVLAQPPSSALAAGSSSLGMAPPPGVTMPPTGPFATGRSWQLMGPPDLPTPAGTDGPVDMHGNSVQYDPGAAPDPAGWAVADTGRRFVVPSVRLNVPLGAVSASHGSVTPPGYRSVYLIRSMGVPLENARNGTVYAATHALRSGTAPGNSVIDVRHRTSSLRNGAAIVVGGLTYHVTGSQTIAKPELSAPRDIWRNRPGRLVLITCLQLAPNQPAVQNLIITAQL